MTTNTFAYNGFGARVGKTDGGGTTTYLRSGTSVVAPVVSVSGAESATYTPGISERRGSDSRFYHGEIKNFVEQTDSSGQIVSSQQYDAFGNLVSSSGTWNGPFAYGGKFGYQTDGDYGLHLLGHRYYDSTTGRFLSRDPIKDGRNWYVYGDGNPVARTDPWGLAWYYDQRTGNLWWDDPGTPEFDPVYKGRGFSGRRGEHRDNPASESRRNEGPIPTEVSASLHTYMGNIYLQLAIRDDKASGTLALEHYRKAQHLTPDAHGPILGEGRALIVLQRWEPAERAFRRVLQSNPGRRSEALAYEGLANVAWYARADRQGAEQSLEKARQADPTAEWAIRNFLAPRK
jgi:RHS repeat-associated protein